MSQKRYLQIANFDAQLHYKDKNPIWIKLYCSLLDNYDFAQIPDATKFHAIGLMILAGRLNNRLPDDEIWLRQKINANSKINLTLLLEIRFLEPIRGARRKAKNSFNAANSMKTQDNVYRVEMTSELDQNRTEEKRKDENTTQQNGENRDENNSVVVVSDFNFSENQSKEEEVFKNDVPVSVSENGKQPQFTMDECLRYVEQCQRSGQPIINKNALAMKLFKSGEADSFIKAALYPEQVAKETYGEPRTFTDELCSVCFGVGTEIVDGRGARPCEHCRNERGKSTGKEPSENS